MFYAKNFVYAGEVSEAYNTEIASYDQSGPVVGSSSASIEILEEWLWKRPKPFFMGVRFTGKNQFPITFFSPDEITALDYSYLESWLLNRPQYQTLSFDQPDMDFYFKAIFTDGQAIRVGNVIHGMQATCITDGPFAYEYPKTTTHTFNPGNVNETITFFNRSHNKDYLHPSMVITMNGTGGGCSIVNTSDSNRASTFTGLSANEILTINNDLEIVDSSLGVVRLSNFNKNFLRLLPGKNVLTVTGYIASISLTYQFLRRIGG